LKVDKLTLVFKIKVNNVNNQQAVEKLTSNKALPAIKLCFPCIFDKFSENAGGFYLAIWGQVLFLAFSLLV